MSSICANLALPDTYVVVYDEKDLRNIVGVGRSADCYVHFQGYLKCRYALVELKGRKLSDALKQLENTIKALQRQGKTINDVYIICSGISRMERRRWVVEDKVLYIKEGGKRRKYLLLNRFPVTIIMRR